MFTELTLEGLVESCLILNEAILDWRLEVCLADVGRLEFESCEQVDPPGDAFHDGEISLILKFLEPVKNLIYPGIYL